MVIDSSKLKYAESGLQSEIHKRKGSLAVSCTKAISQVKWTRTPLPKWYRSSGSLTKALNLQESLKSEKNKHTCPTCGALVSADLSYCGKCGAKLVSAADKEAQQAVKDAEDEILGD